MQSALVIAAAGTAILHTLAGPDHYLPFAVIAKGKGWSRARTALITAACGIGHALSSVVLGLAGIALGKALEELQLIESTRGDWAAWALVSFGLVYLAWGLKSAMRDRTHSHPHDHDGALSHDHPHSHAREHHHVHEAAVKINESGWRGAIAIPGLLFSIFLLGPCEPMIPLILAPALAGDVMATAGVVVLYTTLTTLTMLAVVFALMAGLDRLPTSVARWSNAIAGGTLTACGGAMLAGL